MRKLALRLTVALAAAAVATTVALADTDNALKKKKKKGLFSSLFSTNYERKRKPNTNSKWWLDRNGEVRIIFGGSGDDFADAGFDDDPEGVTEGYGMGNLTYVAPKLAALGGQELKDTRPVETMAAAIYDGIASPDLGIRVLPEARDAILGHYRATGFRPLWIENGRLSPRAAAVLAILADADKEGLTAANYLPPVLSSFDGAGAISASDGADLARLELGLTAMVLKYAREASGGQFEPSRLSRYHDVTPPWVAPEAALRILAWSPYAEDYLRRLQPTHPAYQAMKEALAELREKARETEALAPIDTGKRVKPGQNDERLAAIRERLKALGYGSAAAPDPTLLDPELSEVLKTFQKAEGIKASGNVDDVTIKALNGSRIERDTRRLVYNMERMRWLPRELGKRHVLVNQAAFEVNVIDDGASIWKSRVIVGKPNTQTAVFNDQIELVVFNPSWGVPPSIIANEYLPKLRRDPSYLDRIGFKVTTSSGKTVSSSAIDWSAYGRRVPFSIQQPPGRKNALGELKFLFPNSHNIYMHDTPSRELFDESVRAFSHGCVRVQNPRDYASVLLSWDRAKVDSNTDSKKSQTVKLAKPVPIFITYFTAWPDDTGRIRYFADLYGRDETMEKALSTINLAQR
jgi:murein L,D-transpeptidase YcbB/YkuD